MALIMKLLLILAASVVAEAKALGLESSATQLKDFKSIH